MIACTCAKRRWNFTHSVLVNIEKRYGESTASPGVEDEPTHPTPKIKDEKDGKRAR